MESHNMWPFVSVSSRTPFGEWKNTGTWCYQLLGYPCSLPTWLEASLSLAIHLHRRSKAQIHLLKHEVNGWYFGRGLLRRWREGLHCKSPSKHAPILFFWSRSFIAFPFVLRNPHHPLESTTRLFTNTWTLAYSLIYSNCIPCWGQM